MTRRVVITGMGTVNPLSCDVAAYWEGLCGGKSGIGPIELFDLSKHEVRFGGEVRGFDPDAVLGAKAARRLGRVAK
jgi:3-oxoacyl-[acyl-carrier-protein] synthase II